MSAIGRLSVLRLPASSQSSQNLLTQPSSQGSTGPALSFSACSARVTIPRLLEVTIPLTVLVASSGLPP
eukprot:7201573-Alexandrium_andersonii.AAC.1